MSTKSWNVIPYKTKLGASINDINVVERNRATEWSAYTEVELLQKILQNNYLSKGIHGVIAGIEIAGRYRYAIFVQDNFLVDVTEML